MVLDNGYHTVTIEELTERADVGRTTFYAHYKDKEDLLAHLVTELAEELRNRIDEVQTLDSVGFTGDVFRQVFQHALEERELYLLILRGEGDGRALRQFIDGYCRRSEKTYRARAEKLGVEPRLPAELLARSVAGELSSLLFWWLENDQPYSVEEMSTMMRDLGRHGRFWCAGFS